MSFIPAEHLLGIFTGGWWPLVIAFAVTIIIAFVMRRCGKSAAFVASTYLVLMALVVGTGFVLANWPWLFWIGLVTWGLAVIGVILNTFSLLPDVRWLHATRVFATIAFTAAVVLAANLHLAGLNLVTTSSDNVAKTQTELAQKLESELKDQQAETKKLVAAYKEECKRLPGICAKIDGLEQDVKDLKRTDARIVQILMDRGLTAVPLDLDTKAAAKALAASLAPMGWEKDEVKTGSKIDWSKNQYDAGMYAFTDGKPVSSQSQLAKWFKTTKAGKAAAKEVKKYTPKEYHDLFLSGKNIIPVQFTTTSCVKGNTYYADGEVKRVKGQLCHEAGDIWWVPVAPDGTVYWKGAVRADCGNPHVDNTPYPTRNKTGQPYRHATTQNGGGGGGHHGCTGSNCGQNGGGGGCTGDSCDDKHGDNQRSNENGNGNHQIGQGESTQRQDDPNAAANEAAKQAAAEQAKRDKEAAEAIRNAQTGSGHSSNDSTSTGTSGKGEAGEDDSGDVWQSDN